MASLKLNSEIYDPIRLKWVEKTPEEIIRQTLLKKMLSDLGYPKSLISVEKQLSQLPHLQDKKQTVPNRRADILVFAKTEDILIAPLLMIECKALRLNSKFMQQVIGYNHTVQAPFVGIANEHQIIIGHYNQTEGSYSFQEGLPAYHQLLDLVCQR